MNPVFLLIVVIGILSSIANKNRKEDAKRRSEQQPGYPPQHSPYAQKTGPADPSKAAQQKKTTIPSSGNRKTAPGVDTKWPWPTAEQKAQGQAKKTSNGYGGTPRYTHVVTSTFEGGHTHTESSMTGEDPCPAPEKPVSQQPAASKPASAAANTGLLSFQPNNLLQGVLFAEILGKPKALQGK